MTITYPLTFPSELTFSEMTLSLRTSSAKSTSPFSLEEQVYDFGGEVWEISGSLPQMNRREAEVYNCFLMSLRGQVGTFLMPIAGAKTPGGSWGGTPVVDGGAQTGNDLAISGLPASQTDVAKVGDWLSIGSGASTRLYKVIADADSDGNGNATVTVVPRLRAHNDGDAITVNSAMGLFRLTDKTAGYSASASSLYNIQFACSEAI